MKARISKNLIKASGVVFAVGALAALAFFSRRIPGDPPSSSEAFDDALSLPDVLGVVEDEAGNPLHGALVRAVQITSNVYQSDVREIAVAETLEDGAYSHSGFVLGKRYRLIASAQGFLESSSKAFDFERQRTEINFELSKDESVEFEVDDELEAIFSGAKASADRFHSGRIVYTGVHVFQPIRYTDEQLIKFFRGQEKLYRSDPLMVMSEEQIQYALARDREQMLNAQIRTVASTGRFSGEYIFEGDNSYHYVFLYGKITYERYVYENKATVIEEQSGRKSARIQKAGRLNLSNLRSPLFQFLRLMSSLSSKKWRISDTQLTAGSMAYTLQTENYGTETEAQILPEKSYSISRYNMTSKGLTMDYSFSNMKWSEDLGAYYPTEIREEAADRYTNIYHFEEVEFNKDYDDSIFKPVFEEGQTIYDGRFDPPRSYEYKTPELRD